MRIVCRTKEIHVRATEKATGADMDTFDVEYRISHENHLCQIPLT